MNRSTPQASYQQYFQPSPQPTTAELGEENKPLTVREKLVIAIVFVFIVTMAIYFLVTVPSYDPKIQLNSLDVSNFNLSDSQLTAKWNMGFIVTNPNQYSGAYYDHIDASVLYKSQPLSAGTTVVSSFRQAANTQITVEAHVVALLQSVEDGVAKSIVREWRDGVVAFDVKLQARFMYDRMSRYRREWMDVWCKDLKVLVSSNLTAGTMVVGSKECEVRTWPDSFII